MCYMIINRIGLQLSENKVIIEMAVSTAGPPLGAGCSVTIW